VQVGVGSPDRGGEVLGGDVAVGGDEGGDDGPPGGGEPAPALAQLVEDGLEPRRPVVGVSRHRRPR
jgi:hypothetical protein